MMSGNEKKWEEYNEDLQEESGGVLIAKNKDSKESLVFSFSHAFFKDYHLNEYLNTSCKRMLQLGASTGRFLSDFKKEGWEVMGYDCSVIAAQALERKEITSRQYDLNQLDQSGKLSYENDLVNDIAKPVNILLIRILQYLQCPVLNLLLITLIERAAPGSVFFIAGNVYDDEIQHSSKKITPMTPQYVASFFTKCPNVIVALNQRVYKNDELLVARKI